jgi:hypothetical protein
MVSFPINCIGITQARNRNGHPRRQQCTWRTAGVLRLADAQVRLAEEKGERRSGAGDHAVAREEHA